MIPTKPRLIRAVQRAAHLRATGCAWSIVAQQLQRDEETVRRWPRKYSEVWSEAYRAELERVKDEVVTDGILVLRRLALSDNEKIRCDAAKLLISLQASSKSDTELPQGITPDHAQLLPLLREVENLDEAGCLALADHLLVVRNSLAQRRPPVAEEGGTD